MLHDRVAESINPLVDLQHIDWSFQNFSKCKWQISSQTLSFDALCLIFKIVNWIYIFNFFTVDQTKQTVQQHYFGRKLRSASNTVSWCFTDQTVVRRIKKLIITKHVNCDFILRDDGCNEIQPSSANFLVFSSLHIKRMIFSSILWRLMSADLFKRTKSTYCYGDLGNYSTHLVAPQPIIILILIDSASIIGHRASVFLCLLID